MSWTPPYVFATSPTLVPASELDSNFSNLASYVDLATTGSTGSTGATINVTTHGVPTDGVTDCTAAFQTLINGTGQIFYFPAGTYIFGSGATQLLLKSNIIIYGDEGLTFIKAHSTFTTSAVSEASYKFLWYADTQTKMVFRNLTFQLSSLTAIQAKLGFKNSSAIRVYGCYFQNNSVWDLLFNTCTNFKVTNCDFECGVGGSFGTGMRVCGKSSDWLVSDSRFFGSVVTKFNAGSGVQPSGDKWASVFINADNGALNNLNSNGFYGGNGRFTSDGTGSPKAVTITGISSPDWEAWVEQPFPVSGLSGTSFRKATATVTTNTITFSGLPGGTSLEYAYQYAYFGTTPRDGMISNCSFSGSIYSAVSLINGIRISVDNCDFSHVGDVAWDPEGCLDVTCTNSRFYDCNTVGIVTTRNTIFAGNTLRIGSVPISVDCTNGAAFQAFSSSVGRDYANQPFESASINVAAPSAGLQVITTPSPNTQFTAVSVNEWVSIFHTATWYEYQVTVKTNNGQITVDNTKVRLKSAPETLLSAVVIPTATYTSGNWQKSGYAVAMYGLQGDCQISNNIIEEYTSSISGKYPIGLSLNNNTMGGSFYNVNIDSARDLVVNGGKYSGMLYLLNCAGVQMNGTMITRSSQRSLILNGVSLFNLSNLTIKDGDIYGNTGTPAVIVGNCSHGAIKNLSLVEQNGDPLNGQPSIIEGVYSFAGNTVNTATPNNTYLDVDDIRAVKSGNPLAVIVPTLTVNSTTPSVTLGRIFVTANSSATTITNFLGGTIVGKRLDIKAGDTNTTIQNNANIILKGGVNKTLANNETISFCQITSGVWSQL